MTLSILGTSIGDTGTVYDMAVSRGAKRIDFLRAYLTELYAFSPKYGIRADVLVAQSDLETDSYRSLYYTRDGNVAGFGAFDDGTNEGHQFTAQQAARAQVVHMAGYVGVPVSNEDQRFSPRWKALQASGMAGRVRNVEDLGNGFWATDPNYATKLASRHAAYFGTITGAETVASHRFILSAGHRNTDRGGASNERNWTYGSVVALKQAIEARGGKAWILQEEDGDRDKSDYLNGGLQQAARKCVELASKYGPFDAYISSHYNGGASPGFHAIFPDGANDTKAMNPADVALCRTIRDKVRGTNTVGMLGWTKDSPGVMSEKETGVGSQGYRLGEFVGTIGFRTTTARVIIEAGSIDVARERSFINNPAWVRNVYCEAIVDALEDRYGAFGGTTTKPPVTTPAPTFDKVIPVAALDAYRERPEASVPAYIDADGVKWFTVMREVTFTEATGRFQTDKLTGKVGEDMKPGDTAFIMFARQNSDIIVGYSSWGTRFDMTKTDGGVTQ